MLNILNMSEEQDKKSIPTSLPVLDIVSEEWKIFRPTLAQTLVETL